VEGRRAFTLNYSRWRASIPLPITGQVAAHVDPPLVVLPARLLWDKGVGEFVEAAARRFARKRGGSGRASRWWARPRSRPKPRRASTDGEVDANGWARVSWKRGAGRKTWLPCSRRSRSPACRAIHEGLPGGRCLEGPAARAAWHAGRDRPSPAAGGKFVRPGVTRMALFRRGMAEALAEALQQGDRTSHFLRARTIRPRPGRLCAIDPPSDFLGLPRRGPGRLLRIYREIDRRGSAVVH